MNRSVWRPREAALQIQLTAEYAWPGGLDGDFDPGSLQSTVLWKIGLVFPAVLSHKL